MYWSENGDMVCISTEESYFVLKFNSETVATAQETKEGTFFFLNDLFLYLAIGTVFNLSGIIQNGIEISSKSHV